MKKLFAIAAAAMVAGVAAPAMAVTIIDVSSGTGHFDNVITAPGAFSDVYSFTLPVTGNAVAASVTTIQLQGTDIDFSSIKLDSYNFTQTGFDPGQETWELSNINLGGGAHSLTLSGVKIGNSPRSYSGTIELAGVPEPAVWGMMLLGFGLVGSAMRSRKTTTTVVYA